MGESANVTLPGAGFVPGCEADDEVSNKHYRHDRQQRRDSTALAERAVQPVTFVVFALIHGRRCMKGRGMGLDGRMRMDL